MYVTDIVWCMLYGRTLSVIMLLRACMIIIIVIDDGNVEYKDRQSRPGQDVSATCVIIMCVLLPFPVFLTNPACSVCSVVYGVARRVFCLMDN